MTAICEQAPLHQTKHSSPDAIACGCKGVRTCLICSPSHPVKEDEVKKTVVSLCPVCRKYFNDDLSNTLHTVNISEAHATGAWCGAHTGSCERTDIRVEGITLLLEFVSPEEEQMLLTEMEKCPWKLSQSGRLKQDYGPKANFKKRRVKMSTFDGLPAYSEFLVRRVSTATSALERFRAAEMCNLKYEPTRGSCIDAHIDDLWLWGDQFVILSLQSCTILTFTNPKHPHIEVHIPLPRRSLLVASGEARHVWLHAIARDHVTTQRVSLTLRNLSAEFLSGGAQQEVGNRVLEVAESFQGSVVE